MDIAFFTDSYLPTRDGVAVTVDGLARSLTRQGHQVHVYAPHAVRGEPTRESMEGGVRVVRFRSVPVPLYPQYSQPLFSSVLPLWARPAERVLSRADVVHVHSPGFIGSIGFLLARHLHAPLVGTFHTNLGAMQESVPSKWLIPTFFRLAWWYNVGLYWRCNITTAPTEAARSALLAHASKPFRRPIEVIPNGIDLDNFHPGLAVPDWRTRCGLPPRPLVTYLGRLTVDKGVHRFLDAIATAADLTDMVAIVGGTGPEETTVRERIARDARLSERVRYVGPVAEAEKGALLAQSSIFVLPSTSDTASIGMLEAMACGTPCIGPDVGGPAEIVQDGVTGRRVAVQDPAALARAIVTLVDRPEERRRMGENARTFVRTTASIDAMAARVSELYRRLIDPGASPGPSAPG
ncbi:MAG: glycosyltransferase [Thermoplasmata archaeon]|nr:glycosyltransferase [Thermoplasmata archaeon]